MSASGLGAFCCLGVVRFRGEVKVTVRVGGYLHFKSNLGLKVGLRQG